MTRMPAAAALHKPELLSDPAAMRADGSLAGRYMAEFAEHGASKLISNSASEALLLKQGDLRLPVLVDHGGYGRTYVASPHSAYVLYARDELDIVGVTWGRWGAQAALGVLDGLLRTLRINHTVQLDNWLLATNLHGDWDGADLPAIRSLLTERWPEHYVVLRSLDPWSCPDLFDAAKQDGWTLLPARQIWVTDDLARDWSKRNNTRNDRRALRKSGLTIEHPNTLSNEDCERIAELYRQLYVERYSALNPVFTAHFIETAAQLGLLTFRLARNDAGEIMSVAGIRAAGDTATLPLVGYDTTRPQAEGLYRIATYLASEWAMERNLRFNGSAGAGVFKQNRGARGQIEYMAIYGRHLSTARRAGLAFLASALNALMVPMLKRQGW